VAKLNLLFTPSSPKTGVTSYLTRLSIALSKRNIKVAVVSNKTEECPGLLDQLNRNNIFHYECQGIESLLPFGIPQLKDILRSSDVDVIHAYGVIKTYKFCFAKKIFSSDNFIPVVGNINSLLTSNSLASSITKILVCKILDFSTDMIGSVSNLIRRTLISYGISEDKIVTIHNGIDLEWFDMKKKEEPMHEISELIDSLEDKEIVSYSAWLYPHKRHVDYLQAARIVLKKFPQTVFLVVGGGPLFNYLRQYSKRLGISGNVIFSDHIAYDQIPWLLSKINIGVLASLDEQCPKVVLEYMAAEKPVVATNVGDTQSLTKNGVSGYLVRPQNPRSLASAIIKILDDPQLEMEMGKQGRLLVEKKFNMNAMAARLESLYRSLVNHQGKLSDSEKCSL